jgi:catechol 2,3-dioxygenase-like lactoylglutathione lyase family enzyme
MLKNLMFVTIYVSDQDRALAFYTESLGLEKVADNPRAEGRFLAVAPSDTSVPIVLWPGNPAQSPAVGATTGPVFIESDDLRKEYEVLRSRGVEFAQPEPQDYEFGVRVTALDPDGNRIELRQPNRSRTSDS